jgi:hypothetical protein
MGMRIFSFLFILFLFCLAHLIGHLAVYNDANMFQLGTFNAVSWVFFLLYYGIALGVAIMVVEDL